MPQRLQVLYWVKTKQAETVEHLATLVGRHRTTVSRWLGEYRVGGLAQLLNIQTSPGRTRKIPPSVEAKLREELKDPQGFSSYKEIQVWLKAMCDLDVGYTVAHKLVRYRLKALVKSTKTRSYKTKRRSSRRV